MPFRAKGAKITNQTNVYKTLITIYLFSFPKLTHPKRTGTMPDIDTIYYLDSPI